MNAASDAFMAIFGMKPVTCESCTHALPSVGLSDGLLPGER